jgi:hypothetical protein
MLWDVGIGWVVLLSGIEPKAEGLNKFLNQHKLGHRSGPAELNRYPPIR